MFSAEFESEVCASLLTDTKSWATLAQSFAERVGTASHKADTMNPASWGLPAGHTHVAQTKPINRRVEGSSAVQWRKAIGQRLKEQRLPAVAQESRILACSMCTN